MKIYFKIIKEIQRMVVFLSIFFILIIIPLMYSFNQEVLSGGAEIFLFNLSHWSLLFVMIIRPLSDILPKKIPLRPLVILRKSFGILSASVIVMFIIIRVIEGDNYLLNYLNGDFGFNSGDGKYLARIGDITAVILIITSNNFSKNLLGGWGKIIQKLSYVYFYSGSLYIGLVFKNPLGFGGIVVITVFVLGAGIKNRKIKKEKNAKNS